MPDEHEVLELWLARIERRQDEMTRFLSEHAALPGHSAHADLLARINRLELGVASTLIGVLLLILRTFFGGHA